MPLKIKRAFEREYGKKKGDLIFYKWENKHRALFPGLTHHRVKRRQHMVSMTEGNVKTLYLSDNEYKAYKIIRYGKELGLQPKATHKELKSHDLSSDEMRAGLTAYTAWKSGTQIEKGTPNWAGGF